TTSGPSGRGVALAGGLRLRRDFDRLVLSSGEEGVGNDGPWVEGSLVIPGPAQGSGWLRLGSRCYAVRWGGEEWEAGWIGTFPVSALAFPLSLRGWRPGDRIPLEYGTKKLTKLFAEGRVPAPERRIRPVLADAGGAVLWVPGLARSARIPRDLPGEALIVGIEDADND
ncbi:MAG TPA: tRNA lysidine(34) synthetase TilS, partial [Longimicrobiales bacterium]|nr:tRNA lysidine(34) synthetase TilS [Longimicrobiales bacterium]